MCQIVDIIAQAGGVYRVAGHVGVTRQAVEQWIRLGRIPAERTLAVAELANMRPSDVRPDLYPPGLVA